MNTFTTIRRNVFWSRLFIVAILVTLVLQVFFFLSLPDDQRELFIESFDQTLRRAREGK